ncbi:MAG: peptidylprolyl isomerase [Dehalococcoidia bacterium]
MTRYFLAVLAPVLLLLLALLSLSCNGSEATPTPTPAPTATATPTAPSPTPTPQDTPTPTNGGQNTYSQPPPMTIDPSKQYTATIETAKGNLVLELFAADAPVTVNNFVFLAREGFYDGVTFWRVEPGFMAQGGDPTGTGGGGPGYKFADEFSQRGHGTGTLSMANSGPNTNGSQFFITYTPQHHLDNMHSVFGQLIEGMDVLESLVNGDVMTRVSIAEEG